MIWRSLPLEAWAGLIADGTGWDRLGAMTGQPGDPVMGGRRPLRNRIVPLVGQDPETGIMYMERRGTDMWYAVWIRTGQEEKLLGLCRQRLEYGKAAYEAGDASEEARPAFESCFVPKYERAWRIRGRWEKREEILFPGYLFFITEHPDSLYRLLKEISEFTKLLGDEDGPIPLYEHEVEFLEKYTNTDHVLEMSTGEMIGDKLIVTDGALEGYEGKVVSFDRHRRFVTLEMEFFGKTVNMTVGMEIVKRVKDG